MKKILVCVILAVLTACSSSSNDSKSELSADERAALVELQSMKAGI